MSFRPATREWWMEVASWECQYEYYTEKLGWVVCGQMANHAHHIIGEAETLQHGGDPNENVALPLCQDHHVRNTGETFGEYGSGFHPDMGQAYKSYKEWKQKEEHMNAITGRKRIPYENSPFAEAAKGHKKAIAEGRRYINGDEMTDQYYIDKMLSLAVLYIAKTGQKKPKRKQHPKTNRSLRKKKRWFNAYG